MLQLYIRRANGRLSAKEIQMNIDKECRIMKRNDKTSKNKHRKYDLEERLIDFAVRIINVVEALPNTRAGNHIAGQLVRCGTAAAPNYSIFNIPCSVFIIQNNIIFRGSNE